MPNYPERKTILCIDDDDGMLGYQRALLEDADMQWSLPPLLDRAYKSQQSARLLP